MDVLDYRSLAIGPDGHPVAQPDFCNAAVLLETSLGPRELLEALHEIEAAHGRVRHQRWTARTLDLDLLVYGSEVLREEGLTVPHPRIAGRNFVLVPLRDIAPALEIPGLEMVEAILKDKKKILPCSVFLQGEYGVRDLFVGVPVKLGARGMEQIIEIQLTPDEDAALRKSAAAVKELVDVIKV